VIRNEIYPERIKHVLLEERETEWRHDEGSIIVDVGKPPACSKLTVLYHREELPEIPSLSFNYRIATWCRRRLSEFRDNYVSKSPALQNMVRFVKKFL
jgi:hypothetical protein